MEIELVGEKKINISAGQTILDASIAAGIPHFHACGGRGECSTCRIVVLEGLEYTSPETTEEISSKRLIRLPAKVRLACQTKVTRSCVKIERIIRDEMDIRHYIDANDDFHLDGRLGVERELVMMFVDIRDFTPFAENHLPFDVIYVVRRVFLLINEETEKHNGEIVETAGDGCYVVFGLKNSICKAATDSINCARSIVKELEALSHSYFKKYFSVGLEVGIGIHVGKVIVGNIHFGNRNHKNVMGLPVNIASRLQSITRELDNNIICSSSFYQLVSERQHVRQEFVNLKGIHQRFSVTLIGQPFKKYSSQLNELKQ